MQENPIDSGLIGDLRTKYSEEEVKEIVEFLFYFSRTGQVCAVHIFLAAATLKKRPLFKDLMELFRGQLQVWKTNLGRIGDPDDVSQGLNNAVAYFSIYKTLGLNPKCL